MLGENCPLGWLAPETPDNIAPDSTVPGNEPTKSIDIMMKNAKRGLNATTMAPPDCA